MYDMGTACQECKILRAYTVSELENAINALLMNDWRMKGELIIEQSINGSSGGSSGATQYVGRHGQSDISYQIPTPNPAFMSSQIGYIQVMIR
jgi:hypothetical protein